MMKLFLTLLLFISSFVNADVVKPALVEISIIENKTVEIEIDLSLEAAMTGIGTQYKNTTDAPTSAQYDELRALEPIELRQRFKDFESQFLNSLQFGVNGQIQTLILTNSKLDIVGYKKRPRKTILTYQVTLSDGNMGRSMVIVRYVGKYIKRMNTIGVSGNGCVVVNLVA